MGLLRTAAKVGVASSMHGRAQRRQQQRWAADSQARQAPPPPTAEAQTPPSTVGTAEKLAQLKTLGEPRTGEPTESKRPLRRLEQRAARYDKEHKQATRQRIVEAAGRRFKQDGIDAAGVATLMSDAGLTNGAFYAHFTSKEDLVANVLADQLRDQRQSFDAQSSDRAGLEAFIRSYLSPQHREECADGCPSAALLDEIGRRPVATRQVFTDELMGVIDDIASRVNPTDVEAARTDALTTFGLTIGTLQLARALTDRDLSDQLLARGVEAALKLLEDFAL